MEPKATLIGEGTLWQGEIRVKANGLRIEGCLEGTVFSEGHVLVEPTGLVNGTIHAKRLTVRGRVEGLLKVEECLVIASMGRVDGDVELGTLVVDEGGTLQGTCSRHPSASVKEPVPLVPRKEDPIQDRPPLPVNGTHGGTQVGLPPGRSFDRNRY